MACDNAGTERDARKKKERKKREMKRREYEEKKRIRR